MDDSNDRGKGSGELERAKARIEELEAALARDEFQLSLSRHLLETSDDAVFYADPELRLERANPAFYRLAGIEPGRLAGAGLDLLFDGDDGRAALRLILPRLREEGSWIGETRRPAADGAHRHERLRLSAVRGASGEAIAYLGVVRDLSSLRCAEERLEFSASHDALTGLPNRESFLAALGELSLRAKDSGATIAVCVLDLDDFKRVNNDLSREAGDELLRAVARRLGEAVRSGDLLARSGGDEFSLALELKPGRELRELAARILGLFDAPFEAGGGLLYVNATMGVALCPEHGAEAAELAACADLALQARKIGAKNSYALYRADMGERLSGKASLASELRAAIRESRDRLLRPRREAADGSGGRASPAKRAVSAGRFQVRYQPIVEIASGRLSALEALSRWEHPERGSVPPGRFIPIAEESSLIVELGSLVLQTASAQAGAWLGRGLKPPLVGVNVSARQLQEPAFCDEVRRAIEASGLPRGGLALEVTESQLFEDLDGAALVLRRLREAGALVSVDDFGTGYSSLAYLKKLPIDSVKIDRSFVCDIDRDRHDRRIVEAVVALSREIGARTVAEGVETASQLEILRSIGCDYAQGFLFAPALSPEEIEPFLSEEEGAPRLGAGAAALGAAGVFRI